MRREELLATARKHMWAAWQLSSEELASQAAETLIGLGMLVEEGGAQEQEKLRSRVEELLAERHSTNESLSEAAEQLRVDRDRIAELEALAASATEYRVWEPGYGLYVRRSPGATGFAILESRRTGHGRRAWTKAGLRYTVALSDADLYCWPDAESAVAEARRVLPGAVVREGEPAETGGAR